MNYWLLMGSGEGTIILLLFVYPKVNPRGFSGQFPSCGHTGVPIKISGLQNKTQRSESRRNLWEELRWG